jgi:hypothetical protein
MTKPTRIVIWMVAFLAAVGGAAAAGWPALVTAFMANPVFNGFILGVLLVGILINFRQVFSLEPEVAWLTAFRQDGAPASRKPPRLLASMAQMLGQKRQGRFSLSAMTMRSVLDGIRSRLEETRDNSRYVTGLLIFLGLLGTFWGLLDTIDAVGGVIGGLSVGGADGSAAFEQLKAGLQRPLSGMGTAFSSSLFGLAGALVLGFLDLQAGHAQNRFFNELEEWLSGVTRLSSGPAGIEGEASAPAYVQALLEQTADSLDRLQRVISDREQASEQANDKIFDLTEQLARLTDQMRAEMRLFQTMAEDQTELKVVLRKLGEGSMQAFDDASRVHLRNLDVGVNRISEEAQAGRERVLRELRNELRVLSRTMATALGHRDIIVPEL